MELFSWDNFLFISKNKVPNLYSQKSSIKVSVNEEETDPFKKTALIYTNIPQGHNVLEQGVFPQSALFFIAFLMDMDLVPVPKSVVSNLATGSQY